MKWWDIWTLTSCSCALILHALGIFVLIKTNKDSIRKVVLLLSISSSDLCLALQNILWVVMCETNSKIDFRYIVTLRFGINITFYFGLWMMIFERLLVVLYQANYENCWFEKNIVKLTLVIWFCCCLLWLLCILLSIRYSFTEHQIISKGQSASLVANFISVDLLLMYAIVYRKLKVNELKYQNGRIVLKRESKRLVPMYILSTFILFIVFPDFLVTADPSLLIYGQFFCMLKLLSNAVIYIFLNKSVRTSLQRLVTGKKLVPEKTESRLMTVMHKEGNKEFSVIINSILHSLKSTPDQTRQQNEQN